MAVRPLSLPQLEGNIANSADPGKLGDKLTDSFFVKRPGVRCVHMLMRIAYNVRVGTTSSFLFEIVFVYTS